MSSYKLYTGTLRTHPVAQISLHEIVKLAVEYGLGIAALIFRAMVFDQLIGMQHI